AGVWRGADQRHVNYIEQPRVRAVLVLPLVLRDFLARPGADGPDPWAGTSRRDLTPCHAAARVLLRVGKAHYALDYRHGRLSSCLPAWAGFIRSRPPTAILAPYSTA